MVGAFEVEKHFIFVDQPVQAAPDFATIQFLRPLSLVLSPYGPDQGRGHMADALLSGWVKAKLRFPRLLPPETPLKVEYGEIWP